MATKAALKANARMRDARGLLSQAIPGCGPKEWTEVLKRLDAFQRAAIAVGVNRARE